MPLIRIVGNRVAYNRENAAATPAFYDVGDTWTESTPTFTQITATLRIVGGDGNIDGILSIGRSTRAGPGQGLRRAERHIPEVAQDNQEVCCGRRGTFSMVQLPGKETPRGWTASQTSTNLLMCPEGQA